MCGLGMQYCLPGIGSLRHQKTEVFEASIHTLFIKAEAKVGWKRALSLLIFAFLKIILGVAFLMRKGRHA